MTGEGRRAAVEYLEGWADVYARFKTAGPGRAAVDAEKARLLRACARFLRREQRRNAAARRRRRGG